MAKFNPEGEPGFSPETTRPIERGSQREREEEEEDRQRGLGFIVESGRATPEEAKAYLMKINQLKEKLVDFLNTRFLDLREAELAQHGSTNYFVVYGNEGLAEERRPVPDASTIRSWRPADINTSDAHIWSLMRGINSDSDGMQLKTDVIVRMKDRRVISIPHQGTENMAWHLKEYLDPEELELLKVEYALEQQALIKRLRAEADRLEGNNGILKHGWEPLTWSKRSKK